MEPTMTAELLTHLEHVDTPLRVPRTGAVGWPDEAVHTRAYHDDPQGYALLALAPGTQPWQRARVLLRLLGQSWAALDVDVRATLSRVARVLTLGLPATHVGTVLLALRRNRTNHKQVTRATVRLLAEHPQIDQLIATHRRVLVACVEHALGKSTARGCAREILDGTVVSGEASAHLHRALLRFAPNPEPIRTKILSLYGQSAPPHAAVAPDTVDLDLTGVRPATVTATNRGDIAATLVHLHRGGAAAELSAALAGYVDAASTSLPRLPGTLALVLDCSASMRGYGDREWAVRSQAEALRLVLERRCEQLVVVAVGDLDSDPDSRSDSGRGGTDLATGVLDALASRPNLVAIVSDGYENVYPGELARVVATLPRVGVATPIVFCHSTFSHSDDLTLRRPAPSLPQRTFWHEEDFDPLLLWLLAHTGTAAADQALQAALRQRLTTVERRLDAATTTIDAIAGSPS